jgi:hypothetical protein
MGQTFCHVHGPIRDQVDVELCEGTINASMESRPIRARFRVSQRAMAFTAYGFGRETLNG